MTEFTMEVAGQPIGITAMFSSTRDYCRKYFTEKEPVFRVSTSPEDLEFEQQAAREEAIAEGFRFRNFPDPYLERAAIQRKIAEGLFTYNVLLFHGSAISVDGQGYLFTARSGTGKSTHTRFWQEAFGERAVMVNDDKPFLRMEEGTVLVCGAPWSGKHGLDTNITVPLKAICVLERGPKNRIHPVEAGNVLEMLIHQSNHPLDPAKLPKFRDLIDGLAMGTTFWKMECTRDPEAARVAFEAMSK